MWHIEAVKDKSAIKSHPQKNKSIEELSGIALPAEQKDGTENQAPQSEDAIYALKTKIKLRSYSLGRPCYLTWSRKKLPEWWVMNVMIKTLGRIFQLFGFRIKILKG